MASRDQRRLYAPESAYGGLQTGAMELTQEDSHYVLNVLRLTPGDAVTLFDGAGGVAESVLIPSAKRRLAALNVVTLGASPEPSRRVRVAVAPPKGERTDWLVEKLTELGVYAIHWLHTEFSESQAARVKAARIDRLMGAAARQAGINRIPGVYPPVPLEACLEALPEATAGFIAQPRAPSLVAALSQCTAQDITVVVGPEGGLSSAEVEMLSARGFSPVGLSGHILRVETAALAAAAILLM